MHYGRIVVGGLLAMLILTAQAAQAADRTTTKPRVKPAATVKSDKSPEDIRMARELNDKLDAARQDGTIAATMRSEALSGKRPDPSQPAEDYKDDSSKRKFITMKDEERQARFEEAVKKHEEAIKKIGAVRSTMKSRPGLISAGAADQALKVQNSQYARTLVSKVNFEMSKKLGDLAGWQKQVGLAMRADKNSAEAQKLDLKLEDLAQTAQEKKAKAAAGQQRQEQPKAAK